MHDPHPSDPPEDDDDEEEFDRFEALTRTPIEAKPVGHERDES